MESSSTFYNTREQLEEYFSDKQEELKGFTAIEFAGNSYSIEACEYLAEVIRENASKHFWRADFGHMFVTRSIDDIPVSIKHLIDAASEYKITNLSLADNAIGVRVVPNFAPLL